MNLKRLWQLKIKYFYSFNIFIIKTNLFELIIATPAFLLFYLFAK